MLTDWYPEQYKMLQGYIECPFVISEGYKVSSEFREIHTDPLLMCDIVQVISNATGLLSVDERDT